MSHRPRFDSGDWNVICDVCGREFKASQLRKRWDGFMVCDKDWEPRQPQDFVRGVADIQTPTWSRPEAQDTFINGLQGMPWVAGFAIAGRMVPGLISGPGVIPPSTFTEP